MQQWRARIDALKAREDVQMAAAVEEHGGPDAVTFLSGSPRQQAVWWASLELRRERSNAAATQE